MDKLILKFILWLIRIFANQNIDFEKLKIIAETKVMMDRRRTPVSWKQKQQKERKNPLLMTLIMYCITGIFFGAIAMLVDSIVVSMTLVHSYILFMMCMTLVTDFSSVMLDTNDNNILLPRPINSRTLFLARVTHILVYLFQFMIALALAPIIFVFIKFGPLVGISSIFTVTLTVAFSVFLTNLLYGLILRFGNEQKIKDIIGYFQIFMTVFFAVGYQILPRLIDFERDLNNFSFNLHWYSYLLPPVWMALTLDAVNEFNFDLIHLLMIACTIVIPIFTVWFMVKYMAPSFSRKLAALNNNVSVSSSPKKVRSGSGGLSKKFARLICTSGVELAGFELVWKVTARDKAFKIQFYPSLAYMFIFAFIFIFNSGKNIVEIWNHIAETKLFLWLVYLPLFTIATSLAIIPFNENYKAAWIYQAVPLSKPGEIISGAIKALLLKFFLILFLLLFAFAIYVWGTSIIDDFILGFFNNIMLFLIIANISDHYLPFSQEQNVKHQSGKIIKALFQLLIIGMMIGLHYLALMVYWLPVALIPLSVVAVYFLLKRIQDLSWLKISI